MPNDEMRMIRPRIYGSGKFLNIGLQDVLELMDSFGFSVELKLTPKPPEDNATHVVKETV